VPIRVLDSPEPLSRSSLAEECVLIESHAFRVLSEDMRRYCRGRIAGRSFLISGHRGAGKTTLVASAFLEARRISQGDPSMRRPLLVQLNGPGLLPDVKPRPAAQASIVWDTSAGAAASTSQKDEPPKHGDTVDAEAQSALEQITLCLYRALAREAATSFRERVLGFIDDAASSPLREVLLSFFRRRPPQRAITRWRTQQLVEVAAELELELPQCPEAARLREIWRRADLVSGRGLRLGIWGYGEDRDQGFRELVAVVAAADAYRRISGTLKQEDTAKEGADDKIEASRGLALAGRDLFNSLTALLSGALAGTGFLAGKAGPVPSLLAGVATALGASLVLKITRTRSRTRSRTREYSFLPDTSAATLDRVLPMLIDWLLDAGIAPIFLIDELDKVQDLPRRIVGLVRHLKKLVAERAFFCFLTDRAYFEQVKQQWEGAAYPIEYTYFTHQLYVTFSPGDFHQYLDRLLQPPTVPQPRVAPETAPAEAVQAEPAVASQGASIAEDVADSLVLPYVLLYRSKMHPLDLRRVVAQLSSGSAIALPQGKVRNFNFCLELLMQMAVEMTVDQTTFNDSIEQNPAFYRLVLDALYYPARKWEAKEDLDVGDDGKEDLRRYLVQRMGLDPQQSAAKRIEFAAAVIHRDAGASVNQPFKAEDFELLWDGVHDIVELLSNNNDFKTGVNAWETYRMQFKGAEPLDKPIREALDSALSRGPLLLQVGGSQVYHWRFEVSGLDRPLPEPAGEPAAAPAPQRLHHPARTDRPKKRRKTRPAKSSAAEQAKPPEPPEPPEMGYAVEQAAALEAEPDIAAPAEAEPAPVIQDWRAAAEFIDAVGAALAEISAGPRMEGAPAEINAGQHGEGGLAGTTLDFSTLSSQLHILSTSPAWPEVQRAMTRLRGAPWEQPGYTGYPEAAADAKGVNDFAEMLSASGELLARALVCGALVGKASGLEGPGARLLLGLQVISKAFDFAHQEQEAIGEDLQQVLRKERTRMVVEAAFVPMAHVSSSDAALAQPRILWQRFQDNPPALSHDGIGEWTAWIQRRALAIDKESLFPPSSLHAHRKRAWATWQERLEAFLQRESGVEPGLSDLICMAAGIGPARLLAWKLEQMTIAAWAAATLWALADFGEDDPIGAPPWLGTYALIALGFGQREILGMIGAPSGYPKADRLLPNREPKLLLVRQTQASVADTWTPADSAAIFAPSLELMSRSDKGWPAWQTWARAFAFDKVVVEQPPPAPSGAAQIAAADLAAAAAATEALEKELRTVTGREIVPLFAQAPTAPRIGQIVAPRSLDELIDILHFPGTSSAAT
jgi:hypothetical protein